MAIVQMVNGCLEELACNSNTHVLANFELLQEVDADELGHHRTNTKSLQALHGEGDLPNDS